MAIENEEVTHIVGVEAEVVVETGAKEKVEAGVEIEIAIDLKAEIGVVVGKEM